MNEFLKTILDGIHYVIPSYGWCVVAFTILVRLCLLPLDYKSRVGMRKMQKLAPMQAELQKKYAKDQEKLQRKLSELYRKEGASPMSSCWPLLVSMPILFAMFGAMRMMANEQLIQQTFDIILHGETRLEPFLWVKNIWMPDSPVNAAWPALSSLRMIEAGDWLRVFNGLSAEVQAALSSAVGIQLDAAAFANENLQATVAAIGNTMVALPEYAARTAVIPYLRVNLLITEIAVVVDYNGFFLLPILSAVSQFIMTKTSGNQQPAPTGDNAQKQAGQGAFMKWFFPIFSLWICAGYNAAFAIYWVTSNLIAMLQNHLINWHLDRKEAAAAANPAAATDVRGKGNLK